MIIPTKQIKLMIVTKTIFRIKLFANDIIINIIVVTINFFISNAYHNFLDINVLVQKKTKYEIPVAIAAPIAPIIGINKEFNIKLVTSANADIIIL